MRPQSNRRTDDRLQVRWEGFLTLGDNSSVPCSVLDVSLAGVKIKSKANIAIGDELVLSIPSVGMFAGTVRWLENPYIGLSLEAGSDLLLKRVAENREQYPDLVSKDETDRLE